MDEIQRKLALIDRQLAGGPGFLQRAINTSPLVFVALGLIAGILIQNVLFESQATSPESRVIWLWLAMLGFCATAAILIFAVHKEGKIASYAPVLLSTCGLICFLCLGAIRLTGFYQARPDDIRNFVGNKKGLATYEENAKKKINHELTRTGTNKRANNELVRIRENSWQKSLLSAESADSAVKESDAKLATIRGVIITEPYTNNYGYTAEPNRPDANEIDKSKDYKGVYKQWKFARFQFTDPASSFYLKVSEVEAAGGWVKATGTVRVQVDERVWVRAGDYIQIYCWLDRFKQPTNPGQFNTAQYLARKGVFVAASVPSRDAIELLKNSSARTGTFIKIKRRLQEIAGQALRGNLDIEGQNYALLQALVLGYRTEIDRDTYRAFQKTGLLHFLCLSGMNFVIFVGMIWWLCKITGLTRKIQAIVCIIAAVVFVLVVPSNPPAFRAAIICIVFCSSFFFRRQPNHFNSLSLAAIILLMIKPTDLFEVSWQLSFAAVLGILLFCQRILFFLYEKITGHSWLTDLPKTRPFFQIVPRPGPSVLQLLSTGIAAWAGSAGILLYNFYTIQPLTSIWTVIASPFIAVISFVGYLKLLIGPVLPTAASILDVIIKPLSSWLIWLVKHIASIDASQVLIGHMTIWLIIFYYCIILVIAFVHFKRPLVKKVVSVLMVLAIIIFLGITKWQKTHQDNLIITCLDVGHGQAILAQLPGRVNILFDAGSLQRANVGGRVITPFLDYIGISKIDAIIISHNDIDHINGIPEIVEHCKVKHVYANNAFFSEMNRWGPTKFLSDCLAEKGLKIERLDGGLNLLNSHANIKILWPNSQIPEEKLSDNDKSLVLLIQFAGVKVLLCSDIEKFTQTQLLQTIPDLKADIVIVPHHGSTITSDAAFLEKLGPDILMVSCDRTQYERRLAAGRKDNAKLFYTAKDGEIAVRINKNGTIGTTALSQLN